MAFNQLKGAAGVEFQTKNASEIFTAIDEGVSVGLVGWTEKGPSNRVVTVESTDKLDFLFGLPTKNSENNQMLYAAKMLLEAGAKVKVVRQVEKTEYLPNAVIGLNTNFDPTQYLKFFSSTEDVVISSVVSATSPVTIGSITGTGIGSIAFAKLFGLVDNYSVVSDYNFAEYTSRSFDDVHGLTDGEERDNLNIGFKTGVSDNVPFILCVRNPGHKGYYFSFHTYTNFGIVEYETGKFKTYDTFSTNAVEDIEFATYVKQQGLYDPSDIFNPEDKKFYRGAVIQKIGGVAKVVGGTVNQELTDFINIFGIIRIYSNINGAAIETIPFTRDYYVSVSNIQLRLDEITAKNDIIIGKINPEFNIGSLDTVVNKWLNKLPYVVRRSTVLVPGMSAMRYILTTNMVSNAVPATAIQKEKAWRLFEDISLVDVDFLCSAGETVAGFGSITETINKPVIETMLDVCTKRKDCFAIFDLPKRRKVSTLTSEVDELIPGIGLESGGSSATYETYWGAMYDGRELYFDKINRRDVEVAKTAFVARNIVNVRNTSYPWQIVAGTSRGAIISNGTVYPRKYPDEVGALSLARINSCRNTIDGQFLYYEATLQRKNSALNRLHVVSLLANLYKRYRRILTRFVFELNTPELRRTITSILSEDLKFIKDAKPSGLYNYSVVCDGSNNTPNTIDAQKLIIDISLEPTKGCEQIIMRTTITRTGGIEIGLV